jgi:plastocyanin
MLSARSARIVFLIFLSGFDRTFGGQSVLPGTEVRARLVATPYEKSKRPAEKALPAVLWLVPLRTRPLPSVAPASFTLLQKNKMFTPHLLVVPVGSSVAFPNADPFFHNVFSLFDGKRFDLGLYEAGSTRSVVFSREGVSYIFCNIHSEMSAVVVALSTPYFSIADSRGSFHLGEVPAGDYELHVWVEGQRHEFLEQQTRRVHIAGASVDLGEIRAAPPDRHPHLDKFGHPYKPETQPIY